MGGWMSMNRTALHASRARAPASPTGAMRVWWWCSSGDLCAWVHCVRVPVADRR